MKTHVTCICSFILLVLFSCGGEGNVDSLSQNDLADPQKVAEAFYNAVNKAEYDAAKKFCKIELGDKLDLYKDFKTVEESKPYEFLETVNKKDKYATGDTVTVKYRVGKLKSDFEMVFDTDKFTIISGKPLQIRKIPIKSIDFYNLRIAGKDYDLKSEHIMKQLAKLDGLRFEISDLLVYVNDRSQKGAALAYDPISNSIPFPECFIEAERYSPIGLLEAETHCPEFFLNERKVNLRKETVNKEFFMQLSAHHFDFSFIDNDEIIKLETGKKVLQDRGSSTCESYQPEYGISNCMVCKYSSLHTIEAVLKGQSENNDYLDKILFSFSDAIVVK